MSCLNIRKQVTDSTHIRPLPKPRRNRRLLPSQQAFLLAIGKCWAAVLRAVLELSGGEWQKIALARAYIRKAQIIILDEPTAALDARAEDETFRRFADLVAGQIAFLISHRFSTVRMADRIFVLRQGAIAEQGSHDELLLLDGLYAELFRLQAEGYR